MQFIDIEKEEMKTLLCQCAKFVKAFEGIGNNGTMATRIANVLSRYKRVEQEINIKQLFLDLKKYAN